MLNKSWCFHALAACLVFTYSLCVSVLCRWLCDPAERRYERPSSHFLQPAIGRLLLRRSRVWHPAREQLCPQRNLCHRRRNVPVHCTGRHGESHYTWKHSKYAQYCSFFHKPSISLLCLCAVTLTVALSLLSLFLFVPQTLFSSSHA